MHGKKMLVIDDFDQILDLLAYTFSQAGAQVHLAASGAEGLRQFYAHRPHLVVLDVMMPGMDGWQVCSRIRQVSEVPIVFMTARDAEEDIVRGLDCGAADYVTKPFSPGILLARARSILRRAETARGRDLALPYHDGHLTVDLDARRVWVHGEPVKLTRIEYRLLAYLLENAGRVLTKQQILENVWGWEYRDNLNYVHAFVRQLRKKLEPEPGRARYILTRHGVGYCFRKQPPVELPARLAPYPVTGSLA
jgi:DNA-binding response OmpR family regulator